jgi:nucleoside-diphosphate-sugar epimerase
MHAVVTGATGFLGGRLARVLRARGWRVTGIGRNGEALAALARDGIHAEACDLAEEGPRLARIFDGSNAVHHAAALASAWGDYGAFFRANVVATRNVAQAARAAGVPTLVHVSTPSVYSEPRHRLAIRECDPLPRKAINAYAHTKLLAEREVDRVHGARTSVVILRPQGIIGAGDTALIPRLLEAAARGPLPLIDGGSALVDLTHVDSVVEAHVLAAAVSASAAPRVYNVTNDEPMRVREIIALLAAALGREIPVKSVPFAAAYAVAALQEAHARLRRRDPALTRYAVTALGRSRTLDIRTIRAELGYRPVASVAQGINQFAAWWSKRRGQA